jgi:anti-anti-sigma factor
MFERERQGTVDVVRSASPLIGEHLDRFSEMLEECFEQGQPKAVLDLHQVPLVDSAGLERLLDAQEEFERVGGTIKLAAPNTLCKDILECTGLADHFEVYEDVKAAVGSFVQ